MWKLRVLIQHRVCCLVCRHIVRFLFALDLCFSAWEEHDVYVVCEACCLSEIATVTKGGRVFVNGQLLLLEMYNSYTLILMHLAEL